MLIKELKIFHFLIWCAVKRTVVIKMIKILKIIPTSWHHFRIQIHSANSAKHGPKKTFEKIFSPGSKKSPNPKMFFGFNPKIWNHSILKIRPLKSPFCRFWIELQPQRLQHWLEAGMVTFWSKLFHLKMASFEPESQQILPLIMVSVSFFSCHWWQTDMLSRCLLLSNIVGDPKRLLVASP